MSDSFSVAVQDLFNVERFRTEFMWGTVLAGMAQEEAFRAAVDQAWRARTGKILTRSEYEEARASVRKLQGNIPDSAVLAQLRYHADRLATRVGVSLTTSVVAMPPIDSSSGDAGKYDVVMDRVSWVGTDATAYVKIHVPGPILNLYRVSLIAQDETVAELKLSDLVVSSSRRGEIIVPWGETYPFTQANPLVTTRSATGLYSSALRMNRVDTIPGMWRVDYEKGPSVLGKKSHVPLAFAHVIYCEAAKQLFSTSGTGLTRGVSSQSRSVDGVSHSVNLQASAIYGVNSALENMLDKLSKEMPATTLQRRMVGIRNVAL